MSAADNLKLKCLAMGVRKKGEIEELLDIVGLSDTGKKKVKNFSMGMKQRLGIALALVGDPDLVILDEPINGLDPQGIAEVRDTLSRLNRERDLTMIISSHILDELAKIATHFGFIDRGKIVQEITAKELEHECRKRTRIVVTNASAFSQTLDESGLEYTMLSGAEANVYGEIDITGLVLKLAERDCRVVSFAEQEENLESYFMNLVGARKK